MIDIQILRENPELVKTKSKQKGYDIDIDQIVGFDKERLELLNKVEELRRSRNELNDSFKGAKPSDDQLEKGRQLKEELSDLEHKYDDIELQLNALLSKIPNLAEDDVPVGASEDENVIIKTNGEPTKFDFKPKSHAEIAEANGWLDKTRAAKVAGSRFAYIKGPMVKLQFALVQFVMNELSNEEVISKLVKENNLNVSTKAFVPVIPPALINTATYEATGRLNAEEVTYKIENDDLWLNASAEHSLCSMYKDELLPESELPIRYIGYSTSFRREAGTYGKDMEGIFRTHQFDKLEMETFSNSESSKDEHLLMVAIQEYLLSELGLPYQVIQKCTADIGFPNARGVDINTWIPSQNQYRETHSADYLTDFQARRLKTRYKKNNGEGNELVHTNDATALVLSRIPIAILENYQDAEGRVKVPDILKKYMGNAEYL
jgi:seryl-tRNA synthetase